MNIDDALLVIEKLVDLWPQQTEMPDGSTEAWIAQLQPYDLDVIAEALIALHSESKFRPAWAEVKAMARTVVNRRDAAQQQRALPAAPPDKAALKRAADEARKIGRFKGAAHDHDHTNKVAFGIHTTMQTVMGPNGREQRKFDEPVPGWWFDCPGCGNAALAQYFCSMWTPAGTAYMKQIGSAVDHGVYAAADF